MVQRDVASGLKSNPRATQAQRSRKNEQKQQHVASLTTEQYSCEKNEKKKVRDKIPLASIRKAKRLLRNISKTRLLKLTDISKIKQNCCSKFSGANSIFLNKKLPDESKLIISRLFVILQKILPVQNVNN